jgi:phospholipase A1
MMGHPPGSGKDIPTHMHSSLFSRLILAVAGSALLGVGTSVSARSLADCARITDDAERLSCFDALASEQNGIEAASSEPRPEPSARQATGDQTATAEAPTSRPPLIDEPEPVALEHRLREEHSGEHNPFVMRSYRPNYVLPATYTPTDLSRDVYDFEPQHAETKFQLSIQFDWWNEPLGPGTAFYFGYTQMSLWQTYNTKMLGEEEDASSPFRETNYEPEIGLSMDTDFRLAGLTFRRARLSLIHTSNGQGGDRSRSWNRLALGTSFGRGNVAGRARVWYRLPEAEQDDNPGITDYMGFGDLILAYKWREQTLAVTLRNNLDLTDNRGAVQVDYSFPLTGRIKGYLQYFNGYGESLIDYNRSVSRIGLGIALTDWL